MATAVGQNPFNLTAAGELGSHRETMLDNELLLRVSISNYIRIINEIYFLNLYFKSLCFFIVSRRYPFIVLFMYTDRTRKAKKKRVWFSRGGVYFWTTK